MTIRRKGLRTKFRLVILGLLSLCWLAAFANPPRTVALAPAPAYYAVTDLGLLPGYAEMTATAINDRGQVVGLSELPGERISSFLCDAGKLSDPGAAIPPSERPNISPLGPDINNAGQIMSGRILLDGGMVADLDFLAGALNNAGQIVGGSSPISHWSNTRVWQAGVTPVIPVGSQAFGINDSGQLVGMSNTSGSINYAFRYDLATGQAVDLHARGNFGIQGSEAFKINAGGQAVGYGWSATEPDRQMPTLWANGAAIDLGGTGQASSINDRQEIAGWTETSGGFSATIWRDSTRFDLNTLVPADSGWALTTAADITNVGQIVGAGNYQGQIRAFLLTPRFRDVPLIDPRREAILALAERGIIQGYGDGTFGPADPVLRAQAAGLIARASGWGAEDRPGTTFPDQGTVDNDLWRNVRTLAHYGVALGFADGTYNPIGAVAEQQVALFIDRAMIQQGSWQPQADTNPYPNLPNGSAQEQADRRDIATYVHYAGPLPERPSGQACGGWDQAATRGWTAAALWQALQTTPTPQGVRPPRIPSDCGGKCARLHDEQGMSYAARPLPYCNCAIVAVRRACTAASCSDSRIKKREEYSPCHSRENTHRVHPTGRASRPSATRPPAAPKIPRCAGCRSSS